MFLERETVKKNVHSEKHAELFKEQEYSVARAKAAARRGGREAVTHPRDGGVGPGLICTTKMLQPEDCGRMIQ